MSGCAEQRRMDAEGRWSKAGGVGSNAAHSEPLPRRQQQHQPTSIAEPARSLLQRTAGTFWACTVWNILTAHVRPPPRVQVREAVARRLCALLRTKLTRLCRGVCGCGAGGLGGEEGSAPADSTLPSAQPAAATGTATTSARACMRYNCCPSSSSSPSSPPPRSSSSTWVAGGVGRKGEGCGRERGGPGGERCPL